LILVDSSVWIDFFRSSPGRPGGELRRMIAHEVEITGKPTVKSLSTTMKEAASTVEELPALDVKSVKELSRT